MSLLDVYNSKILDIDFENIDNLEDNGFSILGSSGEVTISTETIRGSNSFNFTSGKYIQGENNFLNNGMTTFTYSIWFFPTTSGNYSLISTRSASGAGFSVLNINNTGLKIELGGTSWSTTYKPDVNVWNNLVFTFASGVGKLYLNGNLKDTYSGFPISLSNVGTVISFAASQINGNSYNDYFVGNIADIQLYNSCLSENSAKSIFKTRVQIARDGSLFVYRLNETGVIPENNIVFDYKMNANVNGISEFDIKNKFDGNVYFEPDGSAWVKIVHHNNPSVNMFSNNNDFAKSCYNNENCWFNGEVCNYLGSWELMVEQQPETNSAVEKYRWVQNKNPMNASYGDVDLADIIQNTDSVYKSSSYGGIFKSNSGKTYLNANNGSTSSWYGSFGAYTQLSGGIPGWNGKTIKTGYLDLYVRIDNTTISDSGSVFKSFNQGTVFANHIIEY